jgi:hypothetical protein
MREEVRQQVPLLKIKGTIPGIIGKIQSVTPADPEVLEHCNQIFITNHEPCTTIAFTPEEAFNLCTVNDTLCRTIEYPEGPMFWLYFTVFLAISDPAEINEVILRKIVYTLDEQTPMCHKGFLKLTEDSEDALGILVTDTFDDELQTEDTDPIAVGIVDTPTDEFIVDTANFLILNDVASPKLTNTADGTAVTALPS